MECPVCGYSYREGAGFCGQCGLRIAGTVVCAGCGAANPSGHRFCEACGRPLGDEAPAPSPTSTAAPTFARGRYVAVRLLGEGGKKRVYLARDTALDRDVAFAQLRAEGLDAESLIRLRQEAQAMGRLGGHPNVVTVFDVGTDDRDPYIV